MKRQHRVWLLVFCLSCFFSLADAQAQQLEWVRQLGTATDDVGYGVSADSFGNVYVSGSTGGSLVGANAGGVDAFLSKFDASGSLQWTRQLGTTNFDASTGVSADLFGNVYISGYTSGSLGGHNAGGIDAFASKYDAFGNLQWTRQFGTAVLEKSFGVSADALGNVYFTGYTDRTLPGQQPIPNAFVCKYDASGNLQWTRELGTRLSGYGTGVSADPLGNVYVTGSTNNNFAFLRKYDSAGILQWFREWNRQPGTSTYDSNYDEGFGVSADALGNVYITGRTNGDLGGPNAGGFDVFVGKYDATGNLQWARQLGTTGFDFGTGVSTDRVGNVYITGYTSGSLGSPNVGARDAFVGKFDASGKLQWIHQLGTAGADLSNGISSDSFGNVYITGATQGSLGAPNDRAFDAFLAKFSSIPEPGTLLLGMVAGVVCLLPRGRRP